MSEMDENADNLHNMGGQTLKFSCESIEGVFRIWAALFFTPPECENFFARPEFRLRRTGTLAAQATTLDI